MTDTVDLRLLFYNTFLLRAGRLPLPGPARYLHTKPVVDERARELVYEECRWNTLLRMGGTIAVDRIKKYAYWPETASTLTFNYNLWPIPQKVIDSNSDVVLEQNTGWNK